MSDRQMGRKWAVLGAVAFAILVPAVQALTDWGQSAAEFSADGDGTLRAAGYAFSIWSLIYAGLVVYAIYQLLPRRAPPGLLAAVGWPSVIATLGCGLWIIASAADLDWASVAIILISAGAMTLGLARARSAGSGQAGWPRRLVIWPLGLLAGWLTAAAALNILTVLTAQGVIGPEAAQTAALAGVAGVTAAALFGAWVVRVGAYGLAVGWGLVAVAVAEAGPKPIVAVAAVIGAALVLGWTLILILRRPRGLRA
ncbi:MAG: hypothetical protein Q7V15_09420 [Phenylobacterium sp.]|uniref:hypothetical protein n=1 Tax=Phenylobacterium sp. TaxID=1871053 RepID=UPI00271D0CCA|nr:hypothetical protein [Phenylobacterium sp.]MDO8901561.1 hypothetical protein [Phenylobacterium sp.]